MPGFDGRTVLITGGAGGIGAATARAFAREGAKVAVVDRDGEAARAVAEEVGGAAFACDIADPAAVEATFAAAAKALGPVSILVNNAGVAERTRFLDLTADEFRRVLDVNLTGAFLCAQAAARSMIAEGRGGAIVNVASVAGIMGVQNRSAYASAKHGLVGLTRVLAMDLAGDGIRVNAVAPGSVETPLTAPLLAKEGAAAGVARSHPIGRWGQPEEIAEAIVFLASDRASFMTGAVMAVDGGFSAGKRI